MGEPHARRTDRLEPRGRGHVCCGPPRAFLIALVCFVVIGCGAGPAHRLGAPIWRITGPYFSCRDSWRPWARSWRCVMTILGVRILVLLLVSGQRDVHLTATGGAGARGGDAAALDGAKSMFLAFDRGFRCAGHRARGASRWRSTPARRLREILWRNWLTDRVTTDWLDGRAYYRGRSSTVLDRQPGPADRVRHHRSRDDVADAVDGFGQFGVSVVSSPGSCGTCRGR